MPLRDRVVIVTGGARGIGGETAILAAGEGARVAIFDVRQREADATLAQMGPTAEAIALQVDVTDEASISRAVEAVLARWGRIDVLVHAAGILKGATLLVDELDPAVFDEVIAVNLRGAYLCCRAVTGPMRAQRRGVILLIASGAGVRGGSSSVAYGTSKGGVHGLSLVLAPQLEPHGIRVHGICPGSLATELKLDNVADVARARGDDPERARATARAELGDPAGVGRVLTFLASDDADYVRGTIFTR